MNNQRVKVVIKSIERDELGKPAKEATYTTARTIRISGLFPVSSRAIFRDYGLEVTTTHKTKTYETVEVGEIIEIEKRYYLVKEVVKVVRISTLLLERM